VIAAHINYLRVKVGQYHHMVGLAVYADDIMLVRADPGLENTTGKGAAQGIFAGARPAVLAIHRPGIGLIAAGYDAIIASRGVYVRIRRR
jgi:hypothetical protein